MFCEHPVLQSMLKSGCTHPSRVYLAFQTYIELCEVQVLRDVQHHYSKELNLVYLSSKLKEQVTTYVPVSIKDPFTPSWVGRVLADIHKTHPSAKINIVVRESDTTSVQYSVSPGLVPPPSPEATKRKKALKEKKQYLQSELINKRTLIYEEAKGNFENRYKKNKVATEN